MATQELHYLPISRVARLLRDRKVSLLLINFTDRITEIPIREHRDEVRELLSANGPTA